MQNHNEIKQGGRKSGIPSSHLTFSPDEYSNKPTTRKTVHSRASIMKSPLSSTFDIDDTISNSTRKSVKMKNKLTRSLSVKSIDQDAKKSAFLSQKFLKKIF